MAYDDKPNLYCQFIPTKYSNSLVWDGTEKFYDAEKWMEYLIQHFLKPDALAKKELPFLQANYVLDGYLIAQGERIDDRWILHVNKNIVSTEKLR